jgi:hypothetical protein
MRRDVALNNERWTPPVFSAPIRALRTALETDPVNGSTQENDHRGGSEVTSGVDLDDIRPQITDFLGWPAGIPRAVQGGAIKVARVESEPLATKHQAVRLLGHQPVLDGLRALA